MRTQLLSLLAAICAATLLAAGGARADSTNATYYVSLGDSLAQGYQVIGGPGGTSSFAGYNQGYADQLYRALHPTQPDLQLVNLGCGGSSAGSIIDGVFFCSYPQGTQLAEAVAFLNAHPGQTRLITIDVGANDILLPLVGGICFDDATGVLSMSCVQATLPTIEANLTTIIQTIRAAAPGVPIYGMSYYNPFLGFWLLGPAGQTLAHMDELAMETLNAGLVAAYDANGVPVADVAAAFDISNFADTTELKGVGTVPVNVANACNWTWFCTGPPLGPDIHATTDGYGVIAQAFEAVLP